MTGDRGEMTGDRGEMTGDRGEMTGDRGAAAHLHRGDCGSRGECGPPAHPSAVYPPFESLWRQSTPPQSPGNTSMLGSWPSRPGSQRKQRELRERKFDRL